MMQQYMAKENRDWARMRAELLTRIHAEQAAVGLPRADGAVRLPDSFTPFSEQLLPWLGKDIETADQARRLREDLLFATPKEMARLGGKLEDADALYAKTHEWPPSCGTR